MFPECRQIQLGLLQRRYQQERDLIESDTDTHTHMLTHKERDHGVQRASYSSQPSIGIRITWQFVTDTRFEAPPQGL